MADLLIRNELREERGRTVGCEARRISPALFSRHKSGFSNFHSLPSNVYGVEAALLFANGLIPFACIHGPSGWGKTHLLRAAASTITANSKFDCPVWSLRDWIDNPQRADNGQPLILDDAHEVFQSARARQFLRAILERRIRGGKPTLIAMTMPRLHRHMRSYLLSQGRDWSMGQVAEPNIVEKRKLVDHIAEGFGLTMNPGLTALIARRIGKSGHGMVGAIQRLKLVHTNWGEPEYGLKGCGVLHSILNQEGGWDMRDHAYDALMSMPNREIQAAGIAKQEWAVYFLHHILGLSEEQVSSFVRITSGQVYTISNRVASQVVKHELFDAKKECVVFVLKAISGI